MIVHLTTTYTNLVQSTHVLIRFTEYTNMCQTAYAVVICMVGTAIIEFRVQTLRLNIELISYIVLCMQSGTYRRIAFFR